MLILLFLSLALLLSGCVMPNSMDYNSRTYVRKNFIRTYEPVGSKDYVFENKDLKITYKPDIEDAGVSAVFKNKSKDMIKIIWDESVFIDENNSPNRIFHAGVTIKDRDKAQVPTVIPGGLSHSDDLIPTDSPSFYSSQYGAGWSYQPLCGYVESKLSGSVFHDELCIGKPLKYQITYERNGKKHVAEFAFKFVSKEPIKKPKKKDDKKTAGS